MSKVLQFAQSDHESHRLTRILPVFLRDNSRHSWRNLGRSLWLIGLAALLLACQQTGTATPAVAPTKAGAVSAADALASIDGRFVSEAEWQQARAYAQVTMELLAEPGTALDEGSVFNSFLEDLMIEIEAGEAGITISAEDVHAAETRIMQVAGIDAAQLRTYLDRVGLSQEDWVQEMTRAALAANYLEDVVLADVPLSERNTKRDEWLAALAARHQLAKNVEFQPPVGLTVGNLAPDFSYVGLDGTTHSLSELRGQGVILNFWATWCEPCRAEMPLLDSVYQEFGSEGLVVLGVDVGEDVERVQQFVDELGVGFPVALDPQQAVSRQYRVFGMPTTFFIDRNGVINYQLVGQVNRNQLNERIAEILAPPNGS